MTKKVNTPKVGGTYTRRGDEVVRQGGTAPADDEQEVSNPAQADQPETPITEEPED